MFASIDLGAAILVIGLFATAAVAFAASAWTAGRRQHFARLDREPGLPLLGKAPLEAVYAAAVPLGRGLAAIGVSANAVTVASAFIAVGAAVAFATGHFGLGAATAIVAALADALDGIVAREAGSSGRFGQVLDTTVDRYVEALLFGGIAFLVRQDALLFVVTTGALVGGFMVSYASSVLRELGAADVNAPMRRAHRLTYLLGGAVLVPIVEAVLPHASQRVQLAPVLVALLAIAIVGNVSAVTRLLKGARERAPAVSGRVPVASGRAPIASARASRTERAERAGVGIDPAVASERHVTHP